MARVIVFAARLPDLIVESSKARAGTIRWGSAADRDELVAAGANAKWLDSEISHGSMLVVAEEEGRIVGYSCYPTRESMPQYSWLVVRLRPGLDVFSVGGFVIPERRGRRIRGDMKRFAARHFFEQGYQRMISVVEATNTPSIRSNASVGALPLITLTRVRIGKLILVWQGSALRHVRWTREPFVVSV